VFVIVKYQLFTISFFIKTMQKKSWILNTLPNGTHLIIPPTDVKKTIKPIRRILY